MTKKQRIQAKRNQKLGKKSYKEMRQFRRKAWEDGIFLDCGDWMPYPWKGNHRNRQIAKAIQKGTFNFDEEEIEYLLSL